MANLYYNGTLRPEIPQAILQTYPYAYMIVTNKFAACKSKAYFYSTSSYPSTLKCDSGVVVYALDENSGTWVLEETLNSIYIVITGLHWANYDVPRGSASATDIYFHGSRPTSTPVHVTQQWNASIANDIPSITLTMEGCTPGNLLIAAYTVRSANNVITLTTGWNVLGGGHNASDRNDVCQRIFFASKEVKSTSEQLTITQTENKRIYVIVMEISGVSRVEIRNELAAIGATAYTVPGTKDDDGDIMIYAVSAAYYGSGRNQTVTPEDIDKIEGDSGAERLACWFDGGTGALSHTFKADTGSDNYDAVLECVQLFEIIPELTIYGNTVGQAVPQTDWQQEDKSQADYLKNKPQGVMLMPAYTEADYGKVLTLTMNGLAWTEASGGPGGASEFINVEEVAM